MNPMNTTQFWLVLGLCAACLWLPSRAQMATEPLLTRSTQVHPNLVLVFDDSGSMDADFIYQYGGSPGGYGMTGPPRKGSIHHAALSPNVNRIHYDPRIRYKNRVDALGIEMPASTLSNNTSFRVYFYKQSNSATQTNLWTNSGNDPSDGDKSYFRTGNPESYQPSASELAAGASTSISYPNLASKSIADYPKWLARTDCLGSVCTWSEELKNYSVWHHYHSSRDAIAKTGVGLAFKDIGPTIRLGWGTINRVENGALTSGVALFDSTVKAKFYNWLYSMPIGGDTANRRALDALGKYFSRTDSDGPWGSTPNANSIGVASLSSSATASKEASSAHLSCRRSFAMLMTDGYYNDFSIPNIGNVDGSNGALLTAPSGSSYQYKAVKPYTDDYTNTLADFALKYWASDLRPDLANNVPASALNESFWQNMSFYAIGLGIWGTVEPSAANLNALKAGTLAWPRPLANNPTAIDDLWHASINGRGALLTATDSQSLNDSIDSMMASIRQITNTQTGVAVSTGTLSAGTRKYKPQYTTASWSGNITAYELDNNGNESSVAWQVYAKDAAGKLQSGVPPFGSRNLVVGTGADASTNAAKSVNMSFGALSTAGLINDLPAESRSTDMVNFLRGDASKEGDAGTYRSRSWALGDMTNSTPVMIKGAPAREASDAKTMTSSVALEVAASSNPLPGSGSAYTSFRNTLMARNEGVLFVGANDGMLHAFRDGSSSSAGGQEIFGFAPRSVWGKMPRLADPFYQHQYYVDGPQIETDAYWGGSWKQLLVGSTGAGAKSLYALNVTEPLRGGFSNLGTDAVLWEISPQSSGFGNLGYVLTEVQTGPTNGSDPGTFSSVWAGYVGNGYDSASGIASLMVFNLANGQLIRELQTPTASGGPWSASYNGVSTTYKNGLGGVKLVLDSSAQRVLGAYAGDLRGNLWRFDLSDKDPTKWPAPELVHNTGAASPTAASPSGIPRPITAAPEVVIHPQGGRMVVVGTGKFFELSDLPGPYATQSLIGLWDKTSFGTTLASQGSSYPVAASQLDSRVFANGDLTLANGGALTVIDWANKKGWTINLPNSGERLVYPLRKMGYRNSRVLYAATLSPANVSTDPCVQAGTGSQWEIFIDGLYGANPSSPPDVVKANWGAIFGSTPNSTGSYKMVNDIGAQGMSTALMIKSGTATSSSNSTSGSTSGSTSVGTAPGTNTQTQSFVMVSAGATAGKSLQISCALAGCSSAKINTREWRQLYMR
jgi:type IV pilus assembly protein PilY1